MKVKVPFTFPYLAVFLLLTYLCYQAHEMFHHFLGAALCGGFGRMTFTIFAVNEPCALSAVVTLAGPALSFAIAWCGAYFLRGQKYQLFSYTLIFASFAHLRFLLPLSKSGDEWMIARTHLSQPNQYLIAGVLLLLALPPLICAFKAIANRRRILTFIASFLLPMVILIGLTILDEKLLGTDTHSEKLSLLGVPVIVLIVNTAAVLVFVLVGVKFLRSHDELPVNG